MAKSPAEIVQEQEAKELLQDMKETREVTEEADARVSGPEKKPGDKGFKTMESDGELLAAYQDPHGDQRKSETAAKAWFVDSYGNPVLAPL